MVEMNRHGRCFQQTGKQLLLLLAIWVGLIVVAVVMPNKMWMSRRGNVLAIGFSAIAAVVFLAILVISVIRMISYMRWTGKYPYYFLFRKSNVSTDRKGKQ